MDFKRLFGAPKESSQKKEQSTVDTKKLEDLIEGYELKINRHEKNITKYDEVIRTAIINKNKPQAISLMKRKKLELQKKTTIENYKANVENTLLFIKRSEEQIQVISILNNAKTEYQKIHAENIDPDTIKEVMTDMDLLSQKAEELTNIISLPINSSTNDDVTDEEFQQEMMNLGLDDEKESETSTSLSKSTITTTSKVQTNTNIQTTLDEPSPNQTIKEKQTQNKPKKKEIVLDIDF